MRHLLLSFTAFAILALYSCKKDKNQDTPPKTDPPVTYADFTHLKQGNYWIYQIYQTDSNGESGTPLPLFDSVYAGPDTIFKGQQYHTRMVPDGNTPTRYVMELYRDSLHYILTHNRIYSSGKDFSGILSKWSYTMYDDTIADIQVMMTSKDAITTVPAGSFKTITRSEEWLMRPEFRRGGTLRIRNTCLSADEGIISEMMPFYISSLGMRQRRLVRYHVQ